MEKRNYIRQVIPPNGRPYSCSFTQRNVPINANRWQRMPKGRLTINTTGSKNGVTELIVESRLMILFASFKMSVVMDLKILKVVK